MYPKKERPSLPLWQALAWIFVSTLLFSGLPTLGVFYFHLIQENRQQDPAYSLQWIEPICEGGEELPPAYLAEQMGVAAPGLMNLYALSPHSLEEKLMRGPWIQRAKVSRIPPDGVQVTYTASTPLWALEDFSGVLLSAEGTFLPRREGQGAGLPHLFVGGEERGPPSFGSPLSPFMWQTAQQLLQLFGNWEVERVDLSALEERSNGRREIRLQLQGEGLPLLLRLHPDHLLSAAERLQRLLPLMKERGSQGGVVDLRLEQLAFLSEF